MTLKKKNLPQDGPLKPQDIAQGLSPGPSSEASPASPRYYLKDQPAQGQVTGKKKKKKEAPGHIQHVPAAQPPPTPMEVEHVEEPLSTSDSDEYEVETVCNEEAPTNIHLLSLNSPATKKMAQAQVTLRNKKAFLYKIDVHDEIPEYPLEKIKSAYVNKTFWVHSGALIRIINTNCPDIPTDLGIIRMRTTKTEYIPAIIAKERLSFKNSALKQVLGAMKEACHNIGAEPNLTMEEWTLRFTVTSLSEYGRRMLGPGEEPGLWVLHCPEFLEEAVYARYDDGSVGKFLMLKMYINLVRPEFRIRQPEGGWIKKPDSGAGPESGEPRKMSGPPRKYNNRSYRPYDDRRSPRPLGQQDLDQVAAKTAEILAAKQRQGPPAKTEQFYPAMQPSQNPGAVQSMMWPETDIPNISYAL